ncbi:MAG: spore maturation protein [Clostridia bacterium]|nr:spore maturation protein [Clostridia bacterium]
MKTIFFFLIMLGIIAALVKGEPQLVMTALVESSNAAVTRCFTLLGILSVWLGIAKIAEKSGFLKSCSKFLHPLLRRLFPSIPRGHPALDYITMNVSANLFGFGSAATPFGLKAMKELQKLNGHAKDASEAMCTFLAINTSNITLIPTTMVAMRASLGSARPEAIVISSLFASSISTFCAVFLDLFMRRRQKKL